jgi:hypothetical protein
VGDESPSAWTGSLQEHCALHARMPPALRAQTIVLAQRFVGDKRFVGCNGLEVDELMRRVVAFQACALIVGRGLHCYDALQSVLLYPDEFLIVGTMVDDIGVVTEYTEPASGQAIDTEQVVLSWPDVQQAGRDGDGYNVVIHEFAHHLDHSLDGALSAPSAGSSWHVLLEQEYLALCAAADAGEETLIDPYGSEDHAEFFAVASETFIELPRELQALHPQLYASLAALYRIDPRQWPVRETTGFRNAPSAI